MSIVRRTFARSIGFGAWSACKCWEGLLRAVAKAGGRRDETAILLDTFTDAQRSAMKAIGSGPTGTATGGIFLVVIPFRDRWELTDRCLKSLLKQDIDGMHLIIALADNGSVEPATATGIQSALSIDTRARKVTIRHLKIERPFNFSAINNEAVRSCSDVSATSILFLNNDVEFRDPTQLAHLISLAASIPNVGAVGCTLEYPNGTVQHLFAAPGVKIVAAHPLRGRRLPPDAAWFRAPRPVAAVTGALLLVRAEDFAAVGGFDEELPTVGQDIDLCLKLQKLGRINWVASAVRLTHYEGASRGAGISGTEVAHIYEKWGDFLHFNPLYSRRLSRFSEMPVLTPWAWRYPWRTVLTARG